jgi:membrane protease YdiL (CAAX protease family)
MSLPPMHTDLSSEQDPPSTFVNPGASAPQHDSLEQNFDPASQPPTRRIPNLGHALLFLSIAVLMFFLFGAAVLLLMKSPDAEQAVAVAIQHPKLQLAAQAATYLTTLLAAWLFYPVLWQRGFLDGLRWNWPAARRQLGKLIALGILMGAMAQVLTYFISPPKTSPLIDQFFLTQSDAWLITIFGSVIAPVFEEICFRGFLLPAFAIAYDWLSLPRTPEAHARWRSTTALTPAALIFSAILSSLFFALLHREQVEHLWTLLTALFSVSLVLTFVRIKTQSVASSTIVHGAYNSLVFLSLLIATGGYRHLDRITQ